MAYFATFFLNLFYIIFGLQNKLKIYYIKFSGLKCNGGSRVKTGSQFEVYGCKAKVFWKIKYYATFYNAEIIASINF